MSRAARALLVIAAALQVAGSAGDNRAADEEGLFQKELRIHAMLSGAARGEGAEAISTAHAEGFGAQMFANFFSHFDVLSYANLTKANRLFGYLATDVEKISRRTASGYQRLQTKGGKVTDDKFHDYLKSFLTDEGALMASLVNSTTAHIDEFRTLFPEDIPNAPLIEGQTQPLFAQTLEGLHNFEAAVRHAAEAEVGEDLCKALEPLVAQLGAAGSLLAEQVAPAVNQSFRTSPDKEHNIAFAKLSVKIAERVWSFVKSAEKEAMDKRSMLLSLMQGRLQCGGPLAAEAPMQAEAAPVAPAPATEAQQQKTEAAPAATTAAPEAAPVAPMPATEAQQQKTEEKTEETKEQVKASVDFTADRESSKAEEARGVAKAKLTPADEEGQQLMGDGEGGFRPMTDFEKEYLRKELEQDQKWEWDNKTAQATNKPEAESAPQMDPKAEPPAEPAKVTLQAEAAAEPEESASAEATTASPSQPKAEAATATPKAETLAEPKAEPAKVEPQAEATAEPAAAAEAQKVEDQAEPKAEADPSSDVGTETAASPKANPSSDVGTETAVSPKAAGAAEGAFEAVQQSSAWAVSAGGFATACLALLWAGPLL
uniref:Uncharacterized protein n=1 Tax=Alexandrium monilatum TaxID=311494 RepID=A0A7S4VA21_9DINO